MPAHQPYPFQISDDIKIELRELLGSGTPVDRFIDAAERCVDDWRGFDLNPVEKPSPAQIRKELVGMAKAVSSLENKLDKGLSKFTSDLLDAQYFCRGAEFPMSLVAELRAASEAIEVILASRVMRKGNRMSPVKSGRVHELAVPLAVAFRREFSPEWKVSPDADSYCAKAFKLVYKSAGIFFASISRDLETVQEHPLYLASNLPPNLQF